jgi:N-methylhydantoinase A
VEIVNLRVKAVAVTPKVPLVKERGSPVMDPRAVVGRQSIVCGRSAHDGLVLDRSRLRAGNSVRGPALVIDPESTIYLPAGHAARVDGYSNLIIRKGAAR